MSNRNDRAPNLVAAALSQGIDDHRQLRVDGYILHFLATDVRFYDAFRQAVRSERDRNPNADAFQTVLTATRAAMYSNPALMEQGNAERVRLDSRNVSQDLREIRKFLSTDVAAAINELPPHVLFARDSEITRFYNEIYPDRPSRLVPPQGHGILPPYATLERWQGIRGPSHPAHVTAAEEAYAACLTPEATRGIRGWITSFLGGTPDCVNSVIDNSLRREGISPGTLPPQERLPIIQQAAERSGRGGN